MNYYERLESLGWRRVGGNSRYDTYAKGDWRVMVSKYFPSNPNKTGIYFFKARGAK